MMDYIDHDTDLGRALNMLTLNLEDRPILYPSIDIDKLEMLYGQLAKSYSSCHSYHCLGSVLLPRLTTSRGKSDASRYRSVWMNLSV